MLPTVEQVVGVLASVRLGFTDYDLVFTNRRIVVAKVGRSGVAQAAGGLIGYALSKSGEEARRGRYAGLNIDQVLASDKKNFEIPYASVEHAIFNAGISSVTMPTLTLRAAGKKLRFMFTSSFWKKDQTQVAYARDLLASILGSRAEFKRV